jgi:hypothetical protein
LLPAGRHEIAVRDGDTDVRYGAITIVAGCRRDVTIDAPQKLGPVPIPQIEDLDRLAHENARGDAVKILWQMAGESL